MSLELHLTTKIVRTCPTTGQECVTSLCSDGHCRVDRVATETVNAIDSLISCSGYVSNPAMPYPEAIKLGEQIEAEVQKRMGVKYGKQSRRR